MSQENVDAVRRNFQAWNRGDVHAWLESAHPEVEWSSAIARRMQGDATVYRGRAQMRQFWDDWHSVWDLTIDLSDFREPRRDRDRPCKHASARQNERH